MKKRLMILGLLMMFCTLNLFAQSDNYLIKTSHPVTNLPLQHPEEDIQLAGMYMEKAANHYKIGRILYVAAALTPVIFRLTRSESSGSRGIGVGVLAGGALLVGVGFGFSGDINLKKGSGILHRINLINN
jgi:hypothetical protein